MFKAKQPRTPFKTRENRNAPGANGADQTPKDKSPHKPHFYKIHGFQEMETQRYNKRFLLAKHIQIQPDKGQMTLIEHLIAHIEQSFKSVSDKLTQDELATKAHLITDANKSDMQQQARHLKGIFRVGSLEKGILLKTDHELQLVALTSDVPTCTFVTKVLNELEAGDLYKQIKTSAEQVMPNRHILMPQCVTLKKIQ